MSDFFDDLTYFRYGLVLFSSIVPSERLASTSNSDIPIKTHAQNPNAVAVLSPSFMSMAYTSSTSCSALVVKWRSTGITSNNSYEGSYCLPPQGIPTLPTRSSCFVRSTSLVFSLSCHCTTTTLPSSTSLMPPECQVSRYVFLPSMFALSC